MTLKFCITCFEKAVRGGQCQGAECLLSKKKQWDSAMFGTSSWVMLRASVFVCSRARCRVRSASCSRLHASCMMFTTAKQGCAPNKAGDLQSWSGLGYVQNYYTAV